jgi:hypothetical protein
VRARSLLSTPARIPWQKRRFVTNDISEGDPALRAANLALSGRKHREVTRLASIELKAGDPRSGAWEALAMASVGLLAALVVVGVWLL